MGGREERKREGGRDRQCERREKGRGRREGEGEGGRRKERKERGEENIRGEREKEREEGRNLGLTSGFEPPDLDTPGRLPHQQGLTRRGWAAKTSHPSSGPREREMRRGMERRRNKAPRFFTKDLGLKEFTKPPAARSRCVSSVYF